MKKVAFELIVAGSVLAGSWACRSGPALEPADLVFKGGKIVTLADDAPEAQAIAISGHTIVAVGSNAHIEDYVGPDTEVIDLAGRLVVPGFIEGHGHFMGLGWSRMNLDLASARTWDEIVAMVKEAAGQVAPGEWIVGRGWHQEKWTHVPEPAVDGVPLNTALNSAAPDHPVFLRHASGHAALANDRALSAAGIDPSTPDPAGGTIVRDAGGRPTGLLRESAQRAVGAAYDKALAARPPEKILADARRAAELAGRESLAKGVTSFHDAGVSFETIDLYKQLAAEGALPVRLYVMVGGESNADLDQKLPGYRMLPSGNDFLALRSIKRQIDGALGSHGAWLLEPYSDMPGSTGLTLQTPEEIAATADIAARHGFQLGTHAIGDRANRETLDIYERTFKAHADKTDLRWRIEHAQHLHPDDQPRFAKLGVIAAMQGVHCTSDGPWVPKRIGAERAESGAYVWRKLIDSGALVANGTDVPVEDVDPLANFHASVTRRSADGSVFYPEQRMTRTEALRSYTLNNAYAAFEEHLKGSLEPGKLADLVVLSEDILTIPEAQILETKVDLTLVGGQVRFRSER